MVKGGVAPPAPVTPAPSSGVPVVSGTLRLGERLTASGTTGTPAYQWYRCDESGARCGSVHGATKATYTLVAVDVGKTIGLTVKTTDAAGAATSTYASLVGPVAPKTIQLASTARPTIEGTPAKGQSLKPSGGTWTATPTSFGYAWERCNANGRICVPIAGASAESYTATADDVGHALVVIVQATASAGITTTWSAATQAVKVAIGPTATKAPTVAGTALQGSKLTAAAGTWSGQGAVTYAYQWFRCDAVGAHCNSIHGATKSTYTLVAADVGKTIGLTVRATDATGTVPAYASLVGPIAAASAPASSTVQPAVQGDAVQGAALKAGTGSWSSAPTSFSYLWLRCNANGRICSVVTGATAVTYTPVTADVGHALLSVVEASIGGTVQTAFSTATAPVRAAATTP